MIQDLDQLFLLKALSFAEHGRGYCAPNPSVGAVIVNQDGDILATGYHHGAGKPHAEIDALQKIQHQAQGMTIYVTLEPCCHTGKTPPCTDALIQAGIKRVVYGYQDPNPIVFGKGAKLLVKQGIDCEHFPIPEINAFYESYHHWQTTKKPFVTAKIALSLDGKIAGKAGERVQITGEALQELTHFYRKSADAILTTIKTIQIDNPKLNARYQDAIIPKRLYVLDRELGFSPESMVSSTTQSITLFHSKQASVSRQNELQGLGLRCIAVDENQQGLDLCAIVDLIGTDGIHDLWVEAGGKCFSSFVKNNLLQRALVYVAPCWLGEGVSAFDKELSLCSNNAQTCWQQVGSDVMLEIRYHA